MSEENNSIKSIENQEKLTRGSILTGGRLAHCRFLCFRCFQEYIGGLQT